MAKRGKPQLRDLGMRKSKAEITKRVQQAAAQGFRTFDEVLRLKEKAANERMRQLEKAGIQSPAYQAIQARLEVLGRPTKGARGRRFSETGKGTYAEKEILNRILDQFLNQQTSKLTGAREYEDEVWNSANKNNKLADAGITRKEWLDFWASMPDKKERLYGSSQIVAMVRAYSIKNGQLDDQNKMTMQEIADEIQASKNLKDAYGKIGLTYKEVNAARIKRTKAGA